MKTLSRWFHRLRAALCCVAFLLPAAPGRAGEANEKPQLPRSKDTVIVPYDPKKPVREQKPDKLYVPYDRFLELWEAAKETRAAAGRKEESPYSYAISSARYEARVEASRVLVEVSMVITTYDPPEDEPWVTVPMPAVAAFTLDGKPASMSEEGLIVPNPGRHTLTGRFEIPLAPGQVEFSWSTPRAVATRLVLALPDARWTAELPAGGGIVEQTVDGKKTVSAALGDAPEIQVKLVETAATNRASAEPAAAELKTAVHTHGTFERITTVVDFAHPGAPRDSYALRLPKGLALVDIVVPGLRAWKLAEGADAQVLEISLAEPANDGASLSIVTERNVAIPSQQTAPVFTAVARRSERVTLLASGEGVDMKPLPGATLRQLERSTFQNPAAWPPLADATVAGLWAGDGALAYQLSAAPLRHEATVHYVYQVNRRKIELVASMQLHAKGGPLFDASVSLPAGFDVLAVDSQRLQSWWLEDGKLRVRFLGTTPETTPLVLHLVRLYPTAPQQLDVQPLLLDGFAKVNGDAVVAAHKGVDAALKLNEGGEARELDAANAATDFQILPPLERKRGFAFKGQAFAGQVTLAALPPRWNVEWVLHAQAHEAWASLSLKSQLRLRQGSLDVAEFSLPAKFPEARVSGPEVREARSKVAGDRRVYEVHFHDDIYETVDFTVDVDAPMTGELLLPSPGFPGAQIVSGFVVADNASEYEMKLTTEGVEPVRVAELPWQPAVTKSAGVFRVRPSWKVGLAADKLEKTESRSAYCAWAEMTSAVRRDGTEWHKAVWHLQNRSLQFLPVALPAGAELVSARVGGQGVRADSGSVAGKAAILVPLIRTRPGDISYDVEVVWRRPGPKLGGSATRKFDDAELIGITVEQTFWNVWVPEEREVSQSGGNMAEVIEVAREVEKGRAAVEELKALNKLLKSEKLDRGTWENAQRNFDLNSTVVKSKVDDNQKKLTVIKPMTSSASKQTMQQVESQFGELNLGNSRNGEELEKVLEENRQLRAYNESRFTAQQRREQAAQTMLQQQQLLQVGESQSIMPSQGVTNVAPVQQYAVPQQDAAQTLNINGVGFQNVGNDARWRANPANPANPAPQTAPAKPQEVNNFYLNDNIVLKEGKEVAQSKGGQRIRAFREDAGKKAGDALDRGLSKQSDDESRSSTSGALPATPPTAAQPAPPSSLSGPQQSRAMPRVTNNARGNRLQLEEEQKLQVQQQAAIQSAQPAAMTPSQPAGQPMPNVTAPRSAQDSNGPFAPATNAPAAPGTPAPPVVPAIGQQAAEPVASGLENAGRISLTVDFPTEGRVYHFQKVKANATLELGIVDPTGRTPWSTVALCAGLAALLALIGRMTTRRSSTRRA